MKRFLRATAWLSAILLLFGGCAATPADSTATAATSAHITTIMEGIPLYGDVVETALCDNTLLLSAWQSGADTAQGDMFLFDLESGKQTGQLALPAALWSVGPLTDGAYSVSLHDGAVTLYNAALQWRLAWKLARPMAFAQVSPSGEWLLYGDAAAGTVVLRRLQTGEERTVLSFAGNIEAVGTRDDSFYIVCNAEELLRIDPQKEYAEALVVDSHLHRFSPYYCVGTDETCWHAVAADRPTQAITLPAEGENEELIATGESGWITAEAIGDVTTVRLYRPYADTTPVATVTKRLLQAVCVADTALLITTDGNTLSLERLQPLDGAQPPDTSTRSGTRFVLEEVPLIPQNPDFPTGCESVCAVMALQYAGEEVSVARFIDNYLPISNEPITKEDGRYYGPNPNEVFVGDPRTVSSFGCMAPVIESAIDTYYGTDTRTVNTTGMSLEMLCEQYVAAGTPVLTWVTVAMREVEARTSWYTPDGELFTWPGNEHCMVLVGYDAEKYYFNDPYLGMRVAYNRALAESRYYALGCQSLAIGESN